MSGKKQPMGLGRGLDALLGEEPTQGATGIALRDIEPNPRQPRTYFDDAALAELAESIRQNGVITPITVRKTGQTYQIIAGERRWRASRLAGLDEIPAVVLDVDEQTAYVLALVENLQREDLNPIEEAEGYERLMEELTLTQEGVAERVGRSRPAVANALRLLALPEALRDLVVDGTLSAGHARALLPIADGERMYKAAQTVIERELSVRDTERLVKRLREEEQEKPAPARGDAIYIEELQRTLSHATGRKVTIHHGKKRGKMTIEYYGNEDLDVLCTAIRKLKHE